MSSENFHNTSITIKGLLGLIEAKDIAIPEIQRPFVWKNSQFMIAIKSAGFISNKMVTSNMALDFAYTIHLLLQESDVPVAVRKRIVQKWYVLSVLTGRYSSSPESAFARDIRQITEQGVPTMLKAMEDAILSENFWNVAVPQNLTLIPQHYSL